MVALQRWAKTVKDILWGVNREGFSDGYLRNDDDEWRFLWLTTRDGRHRIVVGGVGLSP